MIIQIMLSILITQTVSACHHGVNVAHEMVGWSTELRYPQLNIISIKKPKSSKNACDKSLASLMFLMLNNQSYLKAWNNPTQMAHEDAVDFYVRKKRLAESASNARTRDSLLQEAFNRTLKRCSLKIPIPQLYTENIKFANKRRDRYIKKAIKSVQANYSGSEEIYLEQASQWNKVAESLRENT